MSFNKVKCNSLITYKLKLGTQQFINGQFHGVSIGKNRKMQFCEGFFNWKTLYFEKGHVLSTSSYKLHRPIQTTANFDFTKQIESLFFPRKICHAVLCPYLAKVNLDDEKEQVEIWIKGAYWKVMHVVNSAVAVYRFSRRYTSSSYESGWKTLFDS